MGLRFSGGAAVEISDHPIWVHWLFFFSFKNSSIAVYTDGYKTRRNTIPESITGKSRSHPELKTTHE